MSHVNGMGAFMFLEGDHVKLSAWYLRLYPETKNPTRRGTVVSYSRRSDDVVNVLWDGTKRAVGIYVKYIELVE